MGGGFSYSSVNADNGNRYDNSGHQQYIEKILKNVQQNGNCDCRDHGEKDGNKEDEFSSINVSDYADLFPFENLVFGGGGAKGVVYPGALQVLEEVDVLKNIKRCAGTSVGSLTALMVALGYTSEEIRKVARMDFREFYDASFGKLSILCNLLRFFGWQPMNSVYDFFGKIVEEKLGNKDATFQDLYQKTGKELCVVVTNLTNMEEEYFHPKTTPDVALRLAIRISISIPGLMQPVKFRRNGKDSVYADGGVLINYPISCFDGWWLSMKREDSFFNKLHSLDKLPNILDRKNRFKREDNTAHKTLGFVLVDNYGLDRYHSVLRDSGNSKVVFPDTHMAREALLNENSVTLLEGEHDCLKRTISKFLEMASKYGLENDDLISKNELIKVFNDDSFTSEEKARLFGENASVETVLNLMDKDGDEKISFKEVVYYCEEMGISIINRSNGLNRQNMDSFFDYIRSVFTTMYVNVDQLGFSVDDLPRTIGLNAHYVTTTSFGFEPEDAEFLDKEAYKSTMTFLRLFAATKLMNNANTP